MGFSMARIFTRAYPCILNQFKLAGAIITWRYMNVFKTGDNGSDAMDFVLSSLSIESTIIGTLDSDLHGAISPCHQILITYNLFHVLCFGDVMLCIIFLCTVTVVNIAAGLCREDSLCGPQPEKSGLIQGGLRLLFSLPLSW